MRGIPPYITQYELKSKKAHIDTRGIEKEEVMERDPNCPNLIESGTYYTKPLHCIRMVSEEFKWDVKEKKCVSIFIRVRFKNQDSYA